MSGTRKDKRKTAPALKYGKATVARKCHAKTVIFFISESFSNFFSDFLSDFFSDRFNDFKQLFSQAQVAHCIVTDL